MYNKFLLGASSCVSQGSLASLAHLVAVFFFESQLGSERGDLGIEGGFIRDEGGFFRVEGG